MQSIHFTRRVGTSPGTITMTVDDFGQCYSPKPGDIAKGSGPVPLPTPTPSKKPQFFIPYATPANVKGLGMLGVINETDWWRTGRPYGLPGTQAVYMPGQPPTQRGELVPIRVPSYITNTPVPMSGFGAFGAEGSTDVYVKGALSGLAVGAVFGAAAAAIITMIRGA